MFFFGSYLKNLSFTINALNAYRVLEIKKKVMSRVTSFSWHNWVLIEAKS